MRVKSSKNIFHKSLAAQGLTREEMMDLAAEVKSYVLSRLGGQERVTEIERLGVDDVVRVLSEFADGSTRAEITPYDVGAPTRLVRIVQSYSGDTIDVSLFLEALRKVLTQTDESEVIRKAALMEGILYAALIEHVWHEAFSRRFANDASNLQGIFEFRPGIMPSGGEG
jgi:hypothetical protein